MFAALNFYATGSYQRGVGSCSFLQMSQSSISTSLAEMNNFFICHLVNGVIQFPISPQQQMEAKKQFLQRHHFPGVIGVVDGTHVAIIAPSEADEDRPENSYVNRKGYHSINAQVIVDANYCFTSVCARYPGSTHDAYIWKNSLARQTLLQQYTANPGTFWLLGDSGYPLEPWLMTPVSNPEPLSPEARYNMRHAAARSVVERAIGILKSRFRCLLKHRVLHYSPSVACNIFNSCVALHNMCVRNNVAFVEGDTDDDDYEDEVETPDLVLSRPGAIERNDRYLLPGRRARETLILHSFTR